MAPASAAEVESVEVVEGVDVRVVTSVAAKLARSVGSLEAARAATVASNEVRVSVVAATPVPPSWAVAKRRSVSVEVGVVGGGRRREEKAASTGEVAVRAVRGEPATHTPGLV